jgi:hypothetical protein
MECRISLNSIVRYLVLGSSLVGLGVLSTSPRAASSGDHQPPMLPRKEVLRVLGAGHINLVADYYWVQTLQATGRATTPEEFRDIFDYADMVTDLDPKYREVYVFAGAVIPVQLGRAKWANTAESTRILEKGYREAPDHILLRILYAFNLSTYEHQPRRAAEIMAETARMPNAPKYLGALATRLFAAAGDFDLGLSLAESLYDESTDAETKAAFELRLKELKLERELVRIDSAAVSYLAREGRRPPDIAALLAAGDLDRPPVDPFGGGFTFDKSGEARSMAQMKRLRLYTPEGHGQ